MSAASEPTAAELAAESALLHDGWVVGWSKSNKRRFWARPPRGSQPEIKQWEPPKQSRPAKRARDELDATTIDTRTDNTTHGHQSTRTPSNSEEDDRANGSVSKRSRISTSESPPQARALPQAAPQPQPLPPLTLAAPAVTAFSNQRRFDAVLAIAKQVIAVNVFDRDDTEADACYALAMDATRPLPPQPVFEFLDEHPRVIASRRLAFNRLDARLSAMVRDAGLPRVPFNLFQRWGFAQRSTQRRQLDMNRDPLLPVNPSVDDALVWELEREGIPRDRAEHIGASIAADCKSEAGELIAMRQQWRDRRVDNSAITVRSAVSRRGVQHVTVSYSGEGDARLSHSIRLNQSHLDKLRRLYSRHTAELPDAVDINASNNAIVTLFRHRLYAMLARYDTISGAGYQAAMPEEAFDYCRDQFSVETECFASPLNCYMPNFHSAFEDTDRHFGSRGSFFRLRATEGSYESNPPFLEEVMTPNAMHMLALLTRAQHANNPLMFVVVWPAWADSPAYELLIRSPLMRRFVELDESEHRYKEGFQHRADQQYRNSQAKSFVFFLQTDAAKERWPITEQRVAEFKQRFA